MRAQQKQTISTSYLDVRTCESSSTFKHLLWASNTEITLDNTLHTNKYDI